MLDPMHTNNCRKCLLLASTSSCSARANLGHIKAPRWVEYSGDPLLLYTGCLFLISWPFTARFPCGLYQHNSLTLVAVGMLIRCSWSYSPHTLDYTPPHTPVDVTPDSFLTHKRSSKMSCFRFTERCDPHGKSRR